MCGVESRHVGGNVRDYELVVEEPSIRTGGGRCRALGEDLERADPVEGEFSLDNGRVGAFPDALTNGSSGVVDPRSTVDGEQRVRAEGVHDGGFAAVETRYVDGVEFPDGAVGALLAGCGEVGVSQLILVETLMSDNVGRVDDGEGKARKAPHTSLGVGPVAALTELL